MRLRTARFLGLTGVLLTALCVCAVWVGGWWLLTPGQAALRSAQGQLQTLAQTLQRAETSLAPLDEAARPQARQAVQGVLALTENLDGNPLLASLLARVGAGLPDLSAAGAALREWDRALAERPTLEGLTQTRLTAERWSERAAWVLSWFQAGVLGLCAGLTLLLAWFGAGQWALARLASERLAPPTPVGGKAAR